MILMSGKCWPSSWTKYMKKVNFSLFQRGKSGPGKCLLGTIAWTYIIHTFVTIEVVQQNLPLKFGQNQVNNSWEENKNECVEFHQGGFGGWVGWCVHSQNYVKPYPQLCWIWIVWSWVEVGVWINIFGWYQLIFCRLSICLTRTRTGWSPPRSWSSW